MAATAALLRAATLAGDARCVVAVLSTAPEPQLAAAALSATTRLAASSSTPWPSPLCCKSAAAAVAVLEQHGATSAPVVRRALTALRALHVHRAAGGCAVNLGAISACILAMVSHTHDAVLTALGLRLLASLAVGETPNDSLLSLVLRPRVTGAAHPGPVVTSAAVDATLMAMKAHPRNVDVALHGAALLYVAVQWSERQLLPAVVDAGAVPALTAALSSFSTDETVATVALTALQTIVDWDGYRYAPTIAEAGGIPAVVAALAAPHSATSERTAFTGCVILRHMVAWKTGALAPATHEQGGLDAVVASLKAWGSSTSLRHAVAAFGVLTNCSGWNSGALVPPHLASGFFAAIVPPLAALGASDARAFFAGCAPLVNVLQQKNPLVRQAAVDARAVPTVATLLQAHRDSPDAATRACWVLAFIASTDTPGARAVVEGGGVPPLVTALRFARTPGVAESAANALAAALDGGEPHAAHAVATEGGAVAAARALKAHARASAKVLQAGIAVLALLAESGEEGMAAVDAARGASAAADALGFYPVRDGEDEVVADAHALATRLVVALAAGEEISPVVKSMVASLVASTPRR